MLPLGFGTRTYRCGYCGMLCRMAPYSYLKWSLVPLALYIASILLIAANMFALFVIAIIAIRIAWLFVAPRLVPLQSMRPKPTPLP